eukprot:TRINITY_DN11396_c0_g1_i1.p1 TRINITY_DN11396_c0_g1~~TRINITY_DN11396_c0_g1_i1.p1  ORF type:complete len:105 (+),score=27.59 TRINITY_DN11396_c0_g1_i1:1-315(+)
MQCIYCGVDLDWKPVDVKNMLGCCPTDKCVFPFDQIDFKEKYLISHEFFQQNYEKKLTSPISQPTISMSDYDMQPSTFDNFTDYGDQNFDPFSDPFGEFQNWDM